MSSPASFASAAVAALFLDNLIDPEVGNGENAAASQSAAATVRSSLTSGSLTFVSRSAAGCCVQAEDNAATSTTMRESSLMMHLVQLPVASCQLTVLLETVNWQLLTVKARPHRPRTP